MRSKRLLAGALAGATTLTVIGGCAAKQIATLEPKLELRNAAQQLGDAQQAGFTLKLTGNPDDLIAAAKLADKTDKTGKATDTDPAELRRVFNSSITFGYDKAGSGTADDRSMMLATVDGVAGTEIRSVDGKLYAKAPVSEIAAKFGATPAQVKELTDDSVGDVPGLGAFFAGKWVSLDVKKLTDLASTATTNKVPKQDLDQAKVMKEFSTGADNLLDGATIVRDTADRKHLVVTTSTTKAYAEAKRIAVAVDKSLGQEMNDAPKDKPIVLDLWIDGGKFTAAEINVLQFIDGATGRVAARIEMTTGAPIAAPEGATTIDLTGLAKPATD
jgi:hypothetical protein